MEKKADDKSRLRQGKAMSKAADTKTPRRARQQTTSKTIIPPFKKPRQAKPQVVPFIKGISEREADEQVKYGEVLNCSPDRKDISESDEDNIPFSQIQEKIVKDYDTSDEDSIPFSQLQRKKTVTVETAATKKQIPQLQLGETCVGRMVLKQFETGIFKGTVMTVTKQRGRYLYNVVYEDGDAEDMNDKELLEGHDMYNRQTDKTFQISDGVENDIKTDGESDVSEGIRYSDHSEGSEYGDSNDEEQTRLKKKITLTRGKQTVKAKLKTEGKPGKRTPQRRKTDPVIDVEALLLSGGKNSVTTKTIDAMTPDEKNDMIGTAGKTLLKVAKKGIRVQAMTVSFLSILLFDMRSYINIVLSLEKIFCCRQRSATQTSCGNESTCQ